MYNSLYGGTRRVGGLLGVAGRLSGTVSPPEYLEKNLPTKGNDLGLALKLCACVQLSRFSRVRLCATTKTAAHQLPCPWDSPDKNTGVSCHFLLQCMKVKSESEVAQSYLTLSDPMAPEPSAKRPGS